MVPENKLLNGDESSRLLGPDPLSSFLFYKFFFVKSNKLFSFWCVVRAAT
jgi:hypothetical protein